MKKLFAIFGIVLALSACTNAKKEEAIRQAAIKATKDSMRVDSFQKAEVAQKQLAAKEAEDKRVLMLSEARAAERAPAARMSSESSTTTTTKKKKGWSSAALGTVIGAGAGGLGGALIDKKKGRGAIIGGVAGAGAGYLIGHGQDKKSGRAQ